jgi:hypothetical protein
MRTHEQQTVAVNSKTWVHKQKVCNSLTPVRKPKLWQSFGMYVGITLGRSMQAPTVAGGPSMSLTGFKQIKCASPRICHTFFFFGSG